MKENKKNKNASKKLVTLASVGLSSAVAFAVAAPLIINAQNSSSKNVSQQPKLALAPASNTDATEVGIEHQAANVSPKYLYSLPVLDPKVNLEDTSTAATTNIVNFVTNAWNGLSMWKLIENESSIVFKNYSTAVQSLMTYPIFMNKTGTMPAEFLSAFAKAKETFNNSSEVNTLYNSVNNIGTAVADKELKITLPLEVRNVATTQVDAITGIVKTDQAANDYLMSTDNFEYTIAEIDLDSLKDKRSLVFSYSDRADQNWQDHDYKIVISNENHEIETFLNNKTSQDISNLLNNQTIFVRDAKATAAKPTTSSDFTNDAPKFSPDKFRFVYKTTKENKRILSLLAKPDKKNVGADVLSIAIDDKNSDKEAIKPATVKWGFLDNSLSPKHTRKIDDITTNGLATNKQKLLSDPIDPNSKMVDDTTTTKIDSTDLSVFSLLGDWYNDDKNYTYTGGQQKMDPSANWIRVFLGKNTKIAKVMQFNGKTDDGNFETGSKNELSIQYTNPGGLPPMKISPDSFVITRMATAQWVAKNPGASLDTQRFAVITDEISNATLPADQKIADNNYLMTDIVLNRGIMSFDATSGDENPLDLKNIAQKVFFENPWSSKIDKITRTKTQVKEIRTSQQDQTTDLDEELLADVMENWRDNNIPADAANHIMSFKELIEFFKKDPSNKPQFDNLDDKFKAFTTAKADLKTAEVTGDAKLISDAKAKVSSTQQDVNNASNVILAWFPKWPFGQNASPIDIKDSQMVFDESVDPTNSSDLTKFIYQYRHFYVDDATGAIIDDGEGSGHTVYGIFEQDSNFKFKLDSNGKKIPTTTDGDGVYQHFLSYTNEMLRWAKDKIGVDVSQKNQFEMPQTGLLNGWVTSVLIKNSGAVGAELKTVASLIAKMWSSAAFTTTPDEDAIKAQISEFMPYDWEKTISLKNNSSHYTNQKVDTSSSEYILSKQYIYMILQAYSIKVFNTILKIKTDEFHTYMLTPLAKTFKEFFGDTDNVKKINSTTISNIDTTSIPELSGVELVSVGTYGVVDAKNGIDSLKSLITFIYNSGLQNRFLDSSVDPALFETYAKDGAIALDDPLLFANGDIDLTKFMAQVGTIIDRTFDKNQNFTSLNKIISKINTHSYDKAADGVTALSDLKNTIRTVTETIVTNTIGYNKLSVFGTEAQYTYLQSLAMGKNLHSILAEYQKRKREDNKKVGKLENDSLQQVNDFLNESKEYDEKSIASLAISLGYYNLEYFVENLTDSTKVANMARELLSKDLSKDIQLKVDDSNQLVNIISQPGSLAKYAFLGIGASTALIGGSIFGLSFRKSVRTSRKNIIMERAIFIGIAVLGIALALFGIIPGIL